MPLKNRLRKLEQRLGTETDSRNVRAHIDLLNEFRMADFEAYMNLAEDLSGWPRSDQYVRHEVTPVSTGDPEFESIKCCDGSIRQVDVKPLRDFLQKREEDKDKRCLEPADLKINDQNEEERSAP